MYIFNSLSKQLRAFISGKQRSYWQYIHVILWIVLFYARDIIISKTGMHALDYSMLSIIFLLCSRYATICFTIKKKCFDLNDASISLFIPIGLEHRRKELGWLNGIIFSLYLLVIDIVAIIVAFAICTFFHFKLWPVIVYAATHMLFYVCEKISRVIREAFTFLILLAIILIVFMTFRKCIMLGWVCQAMILVFTYVLLITPDKVKPFKGENWTMNKKMAIIFLCTLLCIINYSYMVSILINEGGNYLGDGLDASKAVGLLPLYYCISTMTTLGYGDIFPITNKSYALAIAMALTGVWLTAVFIGAVLGIKDNNRKKENGTEGGCKQDMDPKQE